jgi:uncharacterized phage protein gp47/JayE
MQLQLKGFSQLVQDMAATLQGSASTVIDVSVGSVLRAVFEANASVALWLQWLILQVLRTTRAATSTGADLDSWMADFGLSRLPASAATGIVTFARFTPSVPASIPVGAAVKSADGALSFVVVADTTLSTWQLSSNTYLLPSGVASIDLPVSCTQSGSVGNVLANTLTVVASSLPAVDTVTNAAAFTNGQTSETDEAYRTRFQNYLLGLSRATPTAIRSAIAAIQQGLNVAILENTGADGGSKTGSFLILVDDGTGVPSTSLLSNVAAAVDNTRPIGTEFYVQAPQVLTVSVHLVVLVATVLTDTALQTSIATSITDYLNSLPIGSIAYATRIAQCAYSVSTQVLNVSNITLNGTFADVAPAANTVIKSGQVTVTINAR